MWRHVCGATSCRPPSTLAVALFEPWLRPAREDVPGAANEVSMGVVVRAAGPPQGANGSVASVWRHLCGATSCRPPSTLADALFEPWLRPAREDVPGAVNEVSVGVVVRAAGPRPPWICELNRCGVIRPRMPTRICRRSPRCRAPRRLLASPPCGANGSVASVWRHLCGATSCRPPATLADALFEPWLRPTRVDVPGAARRRMSPAWGSK